MADSLLLIDTNIISHALTPTQTAKYAEAFKMLESKYRFAVSGYTKFELLCSSDQAHREKIANYIAQDMTYIGMSEPLMDFAARLCFLYSHHPSTKGHKIQVGDIVNAAIAIAKKCPVFTIDNNDYPTPFFKEIERIRITYDSGKNKEVTDTTYILEPDIEAIKEGFKRYV